MTAASPSDSLRHGLTDLARRRRGLGRWARLCAGLWVWLLAALAVVGFDALWPVGDLGRRTAAVALAAGVVAVFWRLRSRPEAGAWAPHREARRVERWFALASNPLINALWLAPPPELASSPNLPLSPDLMPLSAELAQRSVAQGAAALGQVDTAATLDRRPLRRHAAALALVAVAWVVLLLVQPPLVLGGVARLADWWGDHPPFSLTRFDVTVTPQPVCIGDDALVTAKLSGRIPPSAELVEVDGHGEARQRWPMAAPAAGRFERRLSALREPLTLQVEAGGGRSQRFTITPQPRPKSSSSQQNPSTAPGGDTSDESGGASPARVAALQMEQLADLARRLQALAAQLAARADGASGGGGGDAGQPMPAWMKEELERLLQRLEQFGAQDQALADALRKLAADAGASGEARQMLAAALRDAAQKLGGLQLPAMPGQVPIPGAGRGGDQPSSADLARWLEQVSQAAQRDAAALDDELAKLERALGGTTLHTGVTVPATLPAPGAAPGTGDLHHASAGGTSTDTGDARLQQVPPLYRDLVGRYFQRLAQDQNPPSPGRQP